MQSVSESLHAPVSQAIAKISSPYFRRRTKAQPILYRYGRPLFVRANGEALTGLLRTFSPAMCCRFIISSPAHARCSRGRSVSYSPEACSGVELGTVLHVLYVTSPRQGKGAREGKR